MRAPRAGSVPAARTHLSHASLTLLLIWSWRRVLARLAMWYGLARLTFDWINFLYFYLPGAALVVYLLIHYYAARWIPTIQAQQSNFQLLQGIAAVVAIGLSIAVQAMSYGKVTFSLEQGDRLYVMLSPLRRSTLLVVLWLEGLAFHLAGAVVFFAVTQPVLRALGTPWQAWLAYVLLSGMMLNTLRIPSALWLQRDRFWWVVLRRMIAFGTWIPFVVSVGLVFSNRWAWGVGVMAGLVVAWGVALAAIGVRAAWEPLFTFRFNLVFGRLSRDDSARVLWRRRIPTQWLVRMMERLVRRPLRPVTWIVVLRSLRQRGVVRVWWVLTAGAVAGLQLPPSTVMKVVCFIFFAFLFVQWCRSVFRPLYGPMITDQNWVDPWALRVNAQNLLVRTVAANLVLWLVLFLAVNTLTRAIPQLAVVGHSPLGTPG